MSGRMVLLPTSGPLQAKDRHCERSEAIQPRRKAEAARLNSLLLLPGISITRPLDCFAALAMTSTSRP